MKISNELLSEVFGEEIVDFEVLGSRIYIENKNGTTGNLELWQVKKEIEKFLDNKDK